MSASEKNAMTLVSCIKDLKKLGGKFYKPANVDKVFMIVPKVGLKQLGKVDFLLNNKSRGGMPVEQIVEDSPLHKRLMPYAV